MGTITTTNADGTTTSHRTSARTKRFRSINEGIVALDLSGAASAPALAELSVQGADLRRLELAPLTGHAGLECLTIGRVGELDLAALRTASALESLALSVSGNVPLSFEALAGHPTLHSLALTFENQPELSLDFVRALPALRSLSIEGGEWRELDLEPLRGVPLESLTLCHQYIADVDLDPIAGPSLERLYLMDLESVSLDLSPLARCRALVSLDIQSMTKLESRGGPALDLQPLAEAHALERLCLVHTELAYLDLSPLTKLAKLRHFEPPNVKDMVMGPHALPIEAPALRAYEAHVQD